MQELDEEALLADPALASLDPGLDSVTNLNDPQEYDAALRGPSPASRFDWPDGAGGPGRGRTVHAPVRAATLGEGCPRPSALEPELGTLVVTLNGFELGAPIPKSRSPRVTSCRFSGRATKP